MRILLLLLLKCVLADAFLFNSRAGSGISKLQYIQTSRATAIGGCPIHHHRAFGCDTKSQRSRRRLVDSTGLQSNGSIEDETSESLGIEEELEELHHRLTLIEALEARNTAQLDSFVDEDDQWESMEEEERALLRSKAALLERLELLVVGLTQSWIGAKSIEG